MTASRLCKTKVLAVFKTSAIGGHIRFAKVAAKPISTAKPARIIHGTLAITPTGVKVLKYQEQQGQLPYGLKPTSQKSQTYAFPGAKGAS